MNVAITLTVNGERRTVTTAPERPLLEVLREVESTGEPAVIQAAQRHTGRPLTGQDAVFTALRTWKDQEYD